jgi:DNA-binding LacI/PurR family transcriptional regulator
MDSARRPTSADVARRAGVSRATVSYVLNDVTHQSIPDATRQRVRAAAAELDYTPHAAARTLRAGESRLILLINAGIPYGAKLSAVIDTLSAEVVANGRSLVLWQQHDPRELSATLAHLQPALAITLGQLTQEQRALLARARIPSLETDTGPTLHAVDDGAVLQVRHLAAQGHRQLGYVTTADPQLRMFAGPRLGGIRAACTELGLNSPAVAELGSPLQVPMGDLAAVIRAWTRRPDPVTAVACYNDIYAVACLGAASATGLTVPEDLAIIGMDDEAVSGYTQPPLTTIRLHAVDYARLIWAQASEMLAHARAHAPGPSPSMPVSLVRRQSA